MSYSGLATAAVALAVLAAAVAVTAGVLLCVGRRRLAEKALPVFLGMLVCVILVAFAAVATSESNLRTHTQRTLALASAAERTELSRTGRYTISVFRLERLNPALAADVKVNEPIVRVTSGPGRAATSRCGYRPAPEPTRRRRWAPMAGSNPSPREEREHHPGGGWCSPRRGGVCRDHRRRRRRAFPPPAGLEPSPPRLDRAPASAGPAASSAGRGGPRCHSACST